MAENCTRVRITTTKKIMKQNKARKKEYPDELLSAFCTELSTFMFSYVSRGIQQA
jgi:hypothetical protein